MTDQEQVLAIVASLIKKHDRDVKKAIKDLGAQLSGLETASGLSNEALQNKELLARVMRELWRCERDLPYFHKVLVVYGDEE